MQTCIPLYHPCLKVMSRKLEEANVQMKSDLENMQEELDTQEQLRKQQKEQVRQDILHLLAFSCLLLISGLKPLAVCVCVCSSL